MDIYWDYNFNTVPESKKDKQKAKIAQMKEDIMKMVGMTE